MSTITKAQERKIADWLETHELAIGLGIKDAACSIAAINLSLTGELTDNIPDCMSPVIGRWIIRMQDELPKEMRNSLEWKRLLPAAAGTGREHEKERHTLIINWMWSTVLPELQPIATAYGFGAEWVDMLIKRDSASVLVAGNAADRAYVGPASYTLADPANDHTAAVCAVYAVAVAVANAIADVDATYAYAAGDDAAEAAAHAADACDACDARQAFWQKIDPCALLAKLIAISEIV